MGVGRETVRQVTRAERECKPLFKANVEGTLSAEAAHNILKQPDIVKQLNDGKIDVQEAVVREKEVRLKPIDKPEPKQPTPLTYPEPNIRINKLVLTTPNVSDAVPELFKFFGNDGVTSLVAMICGQLSPEAKKYIVGICTNNGGLQ